MSVSSPQIRRKLYGTGGGSGASILQQQQQNTTVYGSSVGVSYGGISTNSGSGGLVTPPTPSSIHKRPVTLLRSLDSVGGSTAQGDHMTTSVSGGDVGACYDSTANYEISV